MNKLQQELNHAQNTSLIREHFKEKTMRAWKAGLLSNSEKDKLVIKSYMSVSWLYRWFVENRGWMFSDISNDALLRALEADLSFSEIAEMEWISWESAMAEIAEDEQMANMQYFVERN